MKYYNYSVKDVLYDYFGKETIRKMRENDDCWFSCEQKDKLRELCWQHADNMALAYYIDSKYLVDTLIEDDYIVYLYQFQTQKCADIMFMLTEEEASFSIDIEYVKAIVKEWEIKGYDTYIVSACVEVENSNRTERFRLSSHNCIGKGVNFYSIKEVNGKTLLLFCKHRSWRHYFDKIIMVSSASDIKEYECLFSENVTLTRGEEQQKEVLGQGIKNIKEFFQKNSPVRIFYKRFKNTNVYSYSICTGKYEIVIYVNNLNLITEVNILELHKDNEIIYEEISDVKSLVDSIPKLLSVRPLSITQIHGYGIQMKYENGDIRNYYLKMFDQRERPKSCKIDGYIFDEEELANVKITADNSILFQNGYKIEGHILYHRSYQQLQPKIINETYYNKNGVRLESVYSVPLKEFKSHFTLRHYWGKEDQCYGPLEALIDKHGCRISDVSLYYNLENKKTNNKAYPVRIEPTGKYGLILEDGQWLAPPIYDEAHISDNDCTIVKRNINGKIEKFILSETGKEIEFPYEIDADSHCSGLYAFNAKKWEGDIPDKGYYYEHDYMKPGTWGFIDKEGNIVIEPQYVYVDGYCRNSNYCIVAKMIDGKPYWGVIDRDGRETIPCQYDCLYTRWGEAVEFQKNHGDKFGLMDFEGNIILEPMFDYIEAYDKKHNLVTAGEHEYALGVYSIEKGKFIISTEYDSVDYDERIIACEISDTIKERYFDYEGNELDFSKYDSVFECNGYIKVYKDDKVGIIDYEGNEIVPLIHHRCNSLNLDMVKKGIRITGDSKYKGLEVNGKEVIPTIYKDIKVYDKFIVASQRCSGNWCICDTLFTLDGEPILQGTYRNISVSEQENLITAETPEGKVYFRIVIEEK